MKKSILIGMLLIIVTLLCSCNNSERYHFSHSSTGDVLYVSDSKTGRVYVNYYMKYMRTWDPLKKTWTYDKIKKLNFTKKFTDKSKNQPHLKQDSLPKKVTIKEFGRYLKKKLPERFLNVDALRVGQQVLMNHPEYKKIIKGNIAPLSPMTQ